jgi:hypothetical protein
MTTELAMGAVFFVPEVTEAFSHHAWIECIPKLRLGRAQPTHCLLWVPSEQPHKVLDLDKLPHQCRGCVPVLVFGQGNCARAHTAPELDDNR